ncbi:hypothetical protein [Allopontixanthobacter sediminis]|uniref:Uncharacterized protein n=1 Tax=Allopontixanthobacter sediminis TaxID=1689985 RepID=A0A845ATR9_9SPHN|nr:hypothetical protein [Allopontixanthobacter sediminis]MXP42953.1 hypothetical protein [Allopontixanthobacter sediminis]
MSRLAQRARILAGAYSDMADSFEPFVPTPEQINRANAEWDALPDPDPLRAAETHYASLSQQRQEQLRRDWNEA